VIYLQVRLIVLFSANCTPRTKFLNQLLLQLLGENFSSAKLSVLNQ